MQEKIQVKNPNDPRLIQFENLLEVMDELREKCPWDKKQTIQSLRHLTIEETYELADAINENDMESIKGELGDLFLHLVFYSKIATEQEAFTLADVLETICKKLIFRHPHIYSDTVADTEEEVKQNWEKLKLKEGKTSVLEGVPKGLPALIKAMRIQEKVKGIGFDWDEIQQVKNKVLEEFSELNEAIEQKNEAEIIGEFGDVLFSLINYARFINVNPEDALEITNKKFIDRFTLMEKMIKQEGLDLAHMTLEQMDVFWDKAKIQLRLKSSK